MINENIRQLLEENRGLLDGKPVAYDGVADEETWKNAPVRTAFLLKEVNDKNMAQDWDFIGWLAEDAKDASKKLYFTWQNVSLWMEALQTGCSYAQCMNERQEPDWQRLRKNVLSIGVINLKKTAGGGSSDWQEILTAAERNAALLKAQMEIMDAQLVICGGTFEFAKHVFGANKVQTLPCGAHCFVQNGRLYLEFVHPSWYSVNRNILYAYAREVFADAKEILQGLLNA